jgi:hypothetical protein
MQAREAKVASQRQLAAMHLPGEETLRDPPTSTRSGLAGSNLRVP